MSYFDAKRRRMNVTLGLKALAVVSITEILTYFFVCNLLKMD